uniref:Uncharacterized protein n=1 Tax=Rhizophora mucronata TaxID=61149 RepID=A0A2P2QHA8_RHIMU
MHFYMNFFPPWSITGIFELTPPLQLFSRSTHLPL